MPDVLTKIKMQVEDEGVPLNSPQFDYRVLELRVERCKEFQSVASCSDCKAYDYCEITKEYELKKRLDTSRPKP
jgi:hypothetical protein